MITVGWALVIAAVAFGCGFGAAVWWFWIDGQDEATRWAREQDALMRARYRPWIESGHPSGAPYDRTREERPI